MEGHAVGKGHAEIEIDKPADTVWAVAGTFGGLDGWMPGIESCEVQGDDRIIKTMGMVITEHLLSRDDATMEIVYGITDGVPVGSHTATITVAPRGDGSFVTWDVEVEPDDMTDLLQGMYQQSLQALKDHVGG
jgi:carbon monoxide dehydrogenase subunit G